MRTNRLGTFRQLAILFLCAIPWPSYAPAEEAPQPTLTLDKAAATITVDELKAHLTYIASDELEGRDAGSEGCRIAAKYLRKEFRFYGLRPMGDRLEEDGARYSYFQKLQVVGTAELAKEGNFLSLTADGRKTPLKVGESFLPLSLSANAEAKNKEAAFVGYGITDVDAGYDDYAGLDVKDKVVVMLRYEHRESTAKIYQPSRHAWLSTKVQNAIAHGAAGVIIVNGPRNKHGGKGDPFIGLGNVGRTKNDKVPVVHAKPAFLEKLLVGTGKRMLELQTKMDQTKVPSSMLLPGQRISLGTRLTKSEKPTENVIGVLEGGDPKLKDEYIVVGAHYDHIGRGHYGSRWRRRGRGKIHNGADDNGSGTVGVLEIAEAMASLKQRPKRSVLFILFTGEERGLIGSRHFVEHPTVPRARIVAMINLDMIGRSPKGAVSIAGAGTSSVFKGLITRANAGLKLKIRTRDSGRSPSDSMAFVAQRIPVLFYFTGLHKDYHTPDDDVDRINFPDHARIVKHVMRLVTALAGREDKIDYVEVKTRGGVRLGIVPNTDKLPAVVVRHIAINSPAHRAGLMVGDVIVEMGGKPIRNLMDLRGVLDKQKRGNTISIKVKRKASDGKEKTLETAVTF